MQTIYKYELQPEVTQSVSLPQGAEILSVQAQGGPLQLWALVDPSAPLVPRTIEIFGTGHPITEMRYHTRRHISTVQMQGGAVVLHVFELIKQPMGL